MRSTTRALLVLPALLLLSACTPAVTLTAADDATSPACADVVVHLPDTLDGLAARETDAQGTGAWGTPAAVILLCGVEAPAPTSTLRCATFGAVDWLIDDSEDPRVIATTYGRTPAVRVVMEDGVAGGVVLTDLARAVSYLPTDGACLAIGDTP